MKLRKLHTLGIGMVSLALAGSPNAPAGTVNFANNSASKVLNGQTGNPVASTNNVRAALYWSPVGSNAFVQIGAAVDVGVPLPGLFAGGTRTTGPSMPSGDDGEFQVRAWGGGLATYEQALQTPGVLIGQSSILQVSGGNPVGHPPTPPASLGAHGLQSFTLYKNAVPPVILTQPQSQTVAAGTTATFSVAATGEGPLSYWWRFNSNNLADGGPISGATTTTLFVSIAQPADAGAYDLVVSNSAGVVTSLVAVLTVNIPTSSVPLVNRGSAWKYDDMGIDQGTAWRGLTFNDSGWSYGSAQLGYGDNDESCIVRRTVDGVPNLTLYFRQEFEISNPADYETLGLWLLRDDGGVVYLNGTEVFRSPNMPAVPTIILYSSLATSAGENSIDTATIGTSRLVAGRNVIAVEIHQVQPDSADASFDFSLTGNLIPPQPFITIQPQSQTVAAGTTVTFSVAAVGGVLLSYQWRCKSNNLADGGRISGATAANLTVSNVQASDAGAYDVVVTNEHGLAASRVAILTVITCVNPTSGLVAWWPGDGHAKDVVDTNDGILTNGAGFQTGKVDTAFSFDGVDDGIAVPPSPTLDVENAFTIACWVKADDARLSWLVGRFGLDTSGYGLFTSYEGRNYRLQIDYGSTQTDLSSTTPIALGVFQHVVGTFDGAHMSLYVNGQLEASRECAAPPPNDASLMMGRPEVENGYRFRGELDEVLVFNRALSSNEIAAIHRAGSAGMCKDSLPPRILVPPTDRVVALGSTVTLTITALGTPPLGFRWHFNGVPIPGATNSSYSIQTASLQDSGVYNVLVINAFGAVTSSDAILTVVPVVAQTGANMVDAKAAIFGAGNAGSLDGIAPVRIPLVPGVSRVLRMTNVTGSVSPLNFSFSFGPDGGNFQGNTVDIPAYGGISGVRDTSYDGCLALMGVFTAGTPTGPAPPRLDVTTLKSQSNLNPLLCQTFFIGDGLTGRGIGVQQEFYVPEAATDLYLGFADAGSFHGVPGAYADNTGALSVPYFISSALFLFSSPTSQVVAEGSDVTFSVTAGGEPPFTYQWSFDGTNISGATSPSYALSEARVNDSGFYGVIVRNPYGAVTSAVATLTVTNPLCTPPPYRLVAWWKAEGNASGLIGDHDGTLLNGATFAQGKVGQAFSFDGKDDCIVVSSNALTEPFSAITIEGWVFPTRHGHSSNGAYGLTVISKTDGDGFALRVKDGFLQADLRLSDGWCTQLFTNQILPLSTWSHIAITYDGSTVRGYLNGQLLGSCLASGAVTTQLNRDTVLMIGNEPITNRVETEAPGGGFGWEGMIDEIAVYDRGLLSNEIAAIYVAGSAGKCGVDLQSGLVAYYPFQGNADDLSGNGLDGTVYGAVLDTDRFNKTNSSYLFAGTTNWIRSDIDATNFAADFSLAAWVRFKDFDNDFPMIAMGDGYYVVFHGCGPAYVPDGWYQHVGFYQQHLTNENQRMGFMVSPQALERNRWYHVCVTRSGSDYRMYVDSVLSAGTTSPQRFPLVGSRMGFGHVPPGASLLIDRYDRCALHGNLDEIRIYNRPLSWLEVRALWQPPGASNPAPDLVMTSVQAPTHVLTGETMTVSSRVTNQGVTSVTNGFLVRVLLSLDQELGEDVPLGEIPFIGELAPGGFIDSSPGVPVGVPGGKYWLILVVDATNAVAEMDEDNNTTIMVSPIWVEQSYSAEVWTDVEVAPAGTPIRLQGRAVYSDSGEPAAYQPVWVHVLVNKMHMVLNRITADESGTFAATYRSSRYEAGYYDIYATAPGVSVGQAQDSFTLLGMRFEANLVSHTLVGLGALTNVVWLENLGPAPISGLSASMGGTGPELAVGVELPPMLPGSTNLPVVYRIESLVNAAWQGELILRVESLEGVVVELPIDVTVVASGVPRLEAELGPNQARTLTLHGTVGVTYQIIWTTNLVGDLGDLSRAWVQEPAWQLTLTGSQAQFDVPEQYGSPVFFSAYQIDPPTVATRGAGGSPGVLWLFGLPGETYQVESTADLAGNEGWTTLTTVTLTNSLYRLEGAVTNGQELRFRALRQ